MIALARTLRRGARGSDVEAIQRTLVHLGLRRMRRTGFYGPGTIRQVKRFQAKHGIDPSGTYGPKTHEAMRGSFDSMAAYLYRSYTHTQIRERIVLAAMFGYRNSGAIHYTQGSGRMYGVRHRIRPPRIPRYEDCSSFATWCYWLAGARDPNNLHYSGYGFTGTLAQNGRVVQEPQPGDLVLYGPGPTFSHVAVYVGNGLVVSHGSESGPKLVPIDYRFDRAQIRSYV